MYGDFQGIAGKTLQEIEGLEFQGMLEISREMNKQPRNFSCTLVNVMPDCIRLEVVRKPLDFTV